MKKAVVLGAMLAIMTWIVLFALNSKPELKSEDKPITVTIESCNSYLQPSYLGWSLFHMPMEKRVYEFELKFPDESTRFVTVDSKVYDMYTEGNTITLYPKMGYLITCDGKIRILE